MAGATALKAEPEVDAAGQLGFLDVTEVPPAAKVAVPVGTSTAERRTEALMKGYVGDSCGECGNFTLVRNGTCLKCDTCGSTTGCS